MTRPISDILYRDLDINFLSHPNTGDVTMLTNSAAIKRAVKNIVLLNRYDMAYSPYLYGGVLESLFENFTPVLVLQLKNTVKLSVENFEPRVKVISVNVEEQSDKNEAYNLNKNGINIEIVFQPINGTKIETVDVFLKRIR